MGLRDCGTRSLSLSKDHLMSRSLKSFKFAAKLRKLIEVMKKKGDLFLLASQQHRKSYRQIIAKITVKLSQKLPLNSKFFTKTT